MESADALVSTVRGWVDDARAHRRADRRRHLHRLGHSRLPRPAGRVDPQPGGREAVDDPELPGRAGGAQGRLAQPPRLAGLGGATQPRPPRARRARAPRQAARADHPEHRRTAPDRRQFGRAHHRGPRHDAPRHVLGVRAARADGRGARPRARRRGRPGLPGLRRHPQERHDLVRPGAGAGSHRRGDAQRPRGRPAAGRGLDLAGLSRGRRRAAGTRGGRPHRHRQQPADTDGPDRRRRAARRDRKHPAGAVRHAARGPRRCPSRR